MRHKLAPQGWMLSPLHVGPSRVLEVKNWHTHDRAELGLGFMNKGAANQIWYFVPAGHGFYEIMNKHSLKVLDDAQSCRFPGCNVYQHCRHGGANQHWKIKSMGENLIQICPKINLEFALDVSCQRTDDNAPMVLWHNWKGPNQIWRLIPAY